MLQMDIKEYALFNRMHSFIVLTHPRLVLTKYIVIQTVYGEWSTVFPRVLARAYTSTKWKTDQAYTRGRLICLYLKKHPGSFSQFPELSTIPTHLL